MKGFQGTVLYASEGIFTQYPDKQWYPKTCHDKASLKYTMAALLRVGTPAWDMQPFPQSPKELAEEREEQTFLFKSLIAKRESVVEDLFSSNGVSWDKGNAKLVTLPRSSASKKEGAAEAKVGSNEQQHHQQEKKKRFWHLPRFGKLKSPATKRSSNG